MIELVYLGVAVNDLHLQHTAQDLVLVSQPVAISDPEYLDGYGISQSTRQAYYKTGFLRALRSGLAVPHPLQMSLEKAKPLHMKGDLPGLHHPENVLLTQLCINYVEHIDGAAVLPWLKRTCELAKAAEEQKKKQPFICGYLPEQREEMQVFERFADNATMIRRKFPRGVVTRLKVSCKPGYQTLYNDVIAPQFNWSMVWPEISGSLHTARAINA
jgi:hypothetical protein